MTDTTDLPEQTLSNQYSAHDVSTPPPEMGETVTRYACIDSPLGALLLARDAIGICQLTFEHHKHPRPIQPDWQRDDAAFAAARTELDEYFSGKRRGFDLPLSLHGTAFQKRVWQALLDVPYGTTITYAQLADRIDRHGAYHPVGAAVGMNPVSIFVPCHRALGSDGGLTGYAGGIERKVWLLQLEGQLLA
ncbi:MAG TPA: methylated-DNA--[protein]-cysteine S-methyltransferase [Rhodanobacteraceae bacterium]